jgi:hypothetical protein
VYDDIFRIVLPKLDLQGMAIIGFNSSMGSIAFRLMDNMPLPRKVKAVSGG